MNIIINWLDYNSIWLMIGIAALYNSIWLIQYKNKLRIKEWVAVLLAVVHMVMSVLLAKTLAFLEGVPGGMSLYGGLFGFAILLGFAALITKRSVANTYDVFTIPSIVTVACARMNCIISGCCLGTTIHGTDGIRWPTRELELVLYIILYIYIRNKIGKPKYKGKLYPIYMISYGAFRFVIEWFRETDNRVGVFHISHMWSAIAIVAGAIAIYVINRNITDVKGKSKLSKNKKE